MTRTVTSVINGKAVTDAAGTLTLNNPADLSDHVADVSLASSRTFLDACRAAKEAQAEWAATPAPTRGRAIQQIGRLIEANKERLATLVTREIGKPYPEALGEVQEMVDTCDFFLGEGRRLYGQTVPSEMHDKQLFTFRRPVGSLAIITAGNFPVAVPSWYLVPALLCGNSVTWKPAEYAAASAQATAELFWHGGLPEGLLNLVVADGPTTFEGLELGMDAGVIDKVGFTGSVEVGRRIGELAGRNLQQATLELGGKNPLVVMPDADLPPIPGMSMARMWVQVSEDASERDDGFHALAVEDIVGPVVDEDWFAESFADAVQDLPEVSETIHPERELLLVKGPDLSAARARLLVAHLLAPRIGTDWRDRIGW